MSRENETEVGSRQLPRPTRAQRLAAAGFLGAFGLTIVTVLLTGLLVGAPRGPRTQPTPVAATSSPAPAAAVAAPAPAALEPHAADAGARGKAPGQGADADADPARVKVNSDAGEPAASRTR